MQYAFLAGSYAGRGEAGVRRMVFDPGKGFEVEAEMAGLENPSYVLRHPNGQVFYAVEEIGEGAVHACRLDKTLSGPIGGFETEGASPCHLALSGDLTRLYAANYMGGSLSAFALDAEGNLLGRTDVMQHSGSGPNAARQEAAHVHFSAEINGLLYVCDLGMDAIVLYRRDGSHLKAAGRIAMPPGSGPRHLTYSPLRPDCLYCVAELDNRVYAIRREGGGHRIVQALSALPKGYESLSSAAAIHLTPDGALLLSSNRGHDSIAVFPLLTDGFLSEPVISPCVAEPRDFLICGNWVLAASQRDSLIRAYRLDRETLRLEDTGMQIALGKPVCLCPLDMQSA